jgi:hypothetical protein
VIGLTANRMLLIRFVGERCILSVDARSHEDQAHLIIYNRWVMLGGQVAYFVVVLLLYFFYRDAVPSGPMQLWIIMVGIIFIYIALFDAALFFRNPNADELLGFWRAADKKHTILFDLIAVGVIALLLPHGSEGHRLITVSFCVGYVPLQMISDPENVFGNRFSIVAVLGAFVAYLVIQGSTFEYILAAFMVIYGATLFFASDAFRNVVVDALRNRKAAEAATLKLEAALVEVSAERDAKRALSRLPHTIWGNPCRQQGCSANNWPKHLIRPPANAHKADWIALSPRPSRCSVTCSTICGSRQMQ